MASKRVADWARCENGSFTLESAIVMPLLLATIMLFIVFGMYIYQKVIVYYAASSTAERAAFGWDNSNRDARSGMLAKPEYDGLYWRIGDNQMLQSLFGLAGGGGDAQVELSGNQSDANDSGQSGGLPERKLMQASSWLRGEEMNYKGELSFAHGLLQNKVQVKLKQPLSFPQDRQEGGWLSREPKTVAAAKVVDPVEFIRNVDLVRYYTTRFQNRSGGAPLSKTQAAQALVPYQGATGGAAQ
ncbi:hypothetical protein J2T15_000566 [Paenibacillus harenae]|uniref:TadE-like domain-containing protein n=1 Tax=Paenibacillus harenae TaxID=306543 RepID=A0ABT9TUV6_PAEHA|nr:TadE family protein [Paenibacillus harenae]MDQ0060961.1 hypothetical protein [Paenibacillus harenae]MDQ0111150.1 hypothetical protein [Paenibacillus harenae]